MLVTCPDDYMIFDKDTASSMPAVDASSISWRQKIRKEIIEKHENPGVVWMYEAMRMQMKRLKILKESSLLLLTPCKWWIRSYGSLINLITGTSCVWKSNQKSAEAANLKNIPDKSNNILYKEINSHELFICYSDL